MNGGKPFQRATLYGNGGQEGNEFYQTMNVLVEDETDKGERINKVIRYTKGWFLNRGKFAMCF